MKALFTWLHDHITVHVVAHIFFTRKERQRFYERRQFIRDHGAELGEAYAADFFDKYN